MSIDETYLRFCGQQVHEEDFVQAEVILAVNHLTGDPTICYGLAWIQLIAQGYEGPEAVNVKVLRVPVDFETDEPERLAGACIAIKGHCDAPMEGDDEETP